MWQFHWNFLSRQLHIMLLTMIKLINMFLGAHGVEQVPPIPPEKVRGLQMSNRFNRQPRRETPMNHKIQHSFQDQTSTAKVITPPNSTHKMPHYELLHTSGTFFWARWWKFRHVSCWRPAPTHVECFVLIGATAAEVIESLKLKV